MASLAQAKTLGGVGSILGICAIVPIVGWVLSIAGLIMVLIAVKYVSDIAQNKAIFNDMLISTILAIVGIVAGVLVLFGTVFSAVTRLFPGGFPVQGAPPNVAPSDFFGIIGGVILGLAVIWVFIIVSAIFLRRSYGKISTFVGVGMFNTAALLYLIGAALTIVVVGFIIVFVAEILQIVAFFSLPDTPPTPSASPAVAPMTTTG